MPPTQVWAQQRGDAVARFALAYGPCRMQELFPESYAETAAWLSRQLDQAGDSLEACCAALQAALEDDAVFTELAAGCQVRLHQCPASLHHCSTLMQRHISLHLSCQLSLWPCVSGSSSGDGPCSSSHFSE